MYVANMWKFTPTAEIPVRFALFHRIASVCLVLTNSSVSEVKMER